VVDCTTSRPRARLTFAALLLAAAVLGCHRGATEPPNKPEPPTIKEEAPAKPQVAVDPRLAQSFADATRQDPPPSAPRPPDSTLTNKSVGKIYTDVVRVWKDVPFVTPEGKRVEYSATLETDLGPIEMALLSDVAPNHVRNFVALARVGYYDGLQFDHIRHEVSDVQEFKGQTLDLIEGGGPLGAADPHDHDSLGYWLKPEIDAKVHHEEGSVGAVRGEELDSAGCKFYIIAGRAPATLDGNYTVFGKVTAGLDVVRKIHGQPTVELEQESGYSRPEKPVVIRKVTIHTKEVDNPRASAENK
jgi:peptidyl-prolyl cis-trans isomerase B (cyclophilin B)